MIFFNVDKKSFSPISVRVFKSDGTLNTIHIILDPEKAPKTFFHIGVLFSCDLESPIFRTLENEELKKT